MARRSWLLELFKKKTSAIVSVSVLFSDNNVGMETRLTSLIVKAAFVIVGCAGINQHSGHK